MAVSTLRCRPDPDNSFYARSNYEAAATLHLPFNLGYQALTIIFFINKFAEYRNLG